MLILWAEEQSQESAFSIPEIKWNRKLLKQGLKRVFISPS
jgi:hypothetical protein